MRTCFSWLVSRRNARPHLLNNKAPLSWLQLSFYEPLASKILP